METKHMVPLLKKFDINYLSTQSATFMQKYSDVSHNNLSLK